MYLPFFGLNEKPFAITPDPRYLFLSERHSEALAHLMYGITEAGGFMQLTGEVGTGKTTIIRSLLSRIPQNAEVALILNPRITAPEFLLTICEELGIGVPDRAIGSGKDLVDILNDYLLRAHAKGRRVVLVVDEAHNLSPDVLEQVRLLTNLETATQKLLQIILIGQPELRELLDRHDLRQLAQRITGRYHLSPLSKDETAAYVRHRLRVAGSTNDIFTPVALAEIHRLSGGVPRLINVIADRALLGAYTQDRHRVSDTIARQAAQEVLGKRFTPIWLPWAAAAAGVVSLSVLSIALWQAIEVSRADDAQIVASARAPVPADRPAAAPTPGVAPGAASAALVTAAPAGNPAVGQTVGPATGPSPPPPSDPLEKLLEQYAAETDTDNAFNKLFALWNARYLVGRLDGCTQAVQQGLDCFTRRGTVADLRLFNRPVMLPITDTAGRTHQIVLASLDDEYATISLGGAPRRVKLGELSRLWFGDFVLLWRPGTSEPKTLSFGMRGEDVIRLRRDLRRLSGAPPATESPIYDAELVRQVEDFQRQHRLTVDGVAGLQTLLVLDSALREPGTPHLDTTLLARGG